MALVKIEEIKEKVKKIFVREGADDRTADIIARALTDTEMKGIRTHGFVRVPLYVKCLRSGGVRPTRELELIKDTPSMAVVSGKGGLGIAIAYEATQIAIKKAKETGIGIVCVRGSHHLGATGYYASLCADEGMIGMCMSNGNPMIAPTGARTRTLGNNPFAYSVPAGKYGNVIYDIAMSCGSDMKIIAMYKNGEKVPDGWLIDKNGVPTNDPKDYREGGVLLPFGGYKGYGLAMMVEFFASVLSGAGITSEAKAWNTDPDLSEGGNVGHFIMALNVGSIADKDEFVSRSELLIDRLTGAERAVGVDKIYYPGEKEKISMQNCLDSGEIDVADDTLAAIEELLN